MSTPPSSQLHVSTQELIEYATRWASVDTDPETRAEVEALIADTRDRGHDQTLRERFSGRLKFGTAGIRGAIGAGPQRLSSVLIRQVSLGLARYVVDTRAQDEAQGDAVVPLRVVIGYDGRHLSDRFARESAALFAACGFDVLLADAVCPTPILAFAVKYKKAACGVMVTASHNPPQDNGFKVYWGNGAQIIPPQDLEISASIDQVKLEELSALNDAQRVAQASARVEPLDVSFNGDLGRAYWAEQRARVLDMVQDARRGSGEASQGEGRELRPLRVVYTAMHGVGAAWFSEMIAQRPHIELIPVPEQRDPDPLFPTTPFPNPEEEGALDLAIALAESREADLILAHDPDADRLAVVARDAHGELKPFTGDQVGALVAQAILNRIEPSADDLVATTIVSSSLLSEMARAYGVQYAETLTGFKWIANRAIEHEAGAEGGRFLFGYEEAIGYSLFGTVRDKDGLSVGLLIAEAACDARRAGRSLWDLLRDVYERHGLYLSSQVSRVRPGAEGAAQIRGWMSQLRAHPPRALSGAEVIEVTDFLDQPAPLTSDVLRYRLSDGSRVIMRPSGTEPKIKIYFEVRVVSDEPLSAREARATLRLESLTSAFLSHLDV